MSEIFECPAQPKQMAGDLLLEHEVRNLVDRFLEIGEKAPDALILGAQLGHGTIAVIFCPGFSCIGFAAEKH